MPINLAKVNISLQQFQDISSGKYNAGEVKLASETKLAKMNNHVDRTSKNNEKISHAEVIAIKQSLVKALSQHGVGQEEIDRVRQELGLAPAGPSDRTLRFRSVVPLSRQQIREILDRNAQAINRARGPNGDLEHIVGTKSLVDAETEATRTAKRNAVNQALASDRRTVYMDEDIARFSQVVSDAADFVPNDDRPKVLAMAKAQLEALLATCNDRPRENVLATAKFAVPNNGPTIEMPTGLSEKQFAERLENIRSSGKYGRYCYLWLAALCESGLHLLGPVLELLQAHVRTAHEAELWRSILVLPDDRIFPVYSLELFVIHHIHLSAFLYERLAVLCSLRRKLIDVIESYSSVRSGRSTEVLEISACLVIKLRAQPLVETLYIRNILHYLHAYRGSEELCFRLFARLYLNDPVSLAAFVRKETEFRHISDHRSHEVDYSGVAVASRAEHRVGVNDSR